MADSEALLLEIGTEELPPGPLQALGRGLMENLVSALSDAGLAPGSEDHRWFAAPRRIAALVQGVPGKQPDRREERQGPSLKAALDADGNYSKAALGFARSCGVEPDALTRISTDKGERLACTVHTPGRPLAEVLPGIIDQALKKLPIPRPMRWGAAGVEFIRPVHWVVLLHGKTLIETEILGTATGRATRGHRFMAPAALKLKTASNYADVLRDKGRVLADFAERRDRIRTAVQSIAADEGGNAVIRAALLDEATALVEWPVPVVGRFDEEFLRLPREVLVSAMERHQKSFPLEDLGDALMPRFIGISNLESKAPDKVREGYEKVMRPRLADAAFFWEQDRKRRLEDRVDELRDVVFQRKLGSLHDKAMRVQRLAGEIARSAGAGGGDALRAAELCKCDLLTEMVGEFPELQGTMGRYYATHDGERDSVAQAIEEHYQPRFGGDDIPESETGRVLAIADKLDTLVGIFAAGLQPKGDRDPFALRRAGLGVMRILIEGELDLDLKPLLDEAATGLSGRVDVEPDVLDAVYEFMMERLRRYYRDAGIPTDVFEAVLARRPTRPLDFHRRLQAVTAFKALDACESLAAANKRVRNILRQAGERGIAVPDAPQKKRLEEPAEKALSAAVDDMAGDVSARAADSDYIGALTQLAGLRKPVDTFFDDVLVMCDDEKLRDNRLALLARMYRLFMDIADISLLQH